jgi:hypothetical protein
MPIWALTGAEIAFAKATGICHMTLFRGFIFMYFLASAEDMKMGTFLFQPGMGEKGPEAPEGWDWSIQEDLQSQPMPLDAERVSSGRAL